MKFKFIEHTADVGVEAYGENLEETFSNAALGFFEIMTDTSKIEEKEVREFKAKGEDLKSLLYDFLYRGRHTYGGDLYYQHSIQALYPLVSKFS